MVELNAPQMDTVFHALGDATRTNSRSGGTDTILIDIGSQLDFVLAIRGLGLPAVPLAEVVESYTYDLAPDGSLCIHLPLFHLPNHPASPWMRRLLEVWKSVGNRRRWTFDDL